MAHKTSLYKQYRYVYMLHIENYNKSKHFGHTSIYYTGQTNNISKRLMQHINGVNSTFLNSNYRNSIKKLVYIEYIYGTEYQAIQREKQIKSYSKPKKIELINSDNNMLVNYIPLRAIILKKYNNKEEQVLMRL